jgi:hypothetical protein
MPALTGQWADYGGRRCTPAQLRYVRQQLEAQAENNIL